MKKDEMGGVCGIYGRQKECTQDFDEEILKNETL
jgi:hypothetical protein